MILKFNKGGIVKLQNAATTIPTYYNSGSTFEDAWERSQERWDTKKVIEAAEAKAAQRIDEEDKGFLNNMRFSGETGEWSKGADINARMAKYVAEELGLDGNQAFLDSYKRDGATGAAIFASSMAMAPLAGEFATYGALGGLGRIAGGMAGSAVMGKIGEFGGRWLDNKLNTGNTFENVLGIGLSFPGWGVGSRIGYGTAKNAVSRIAQNQVRKTGTFNIPKWIATDNMMKDILSDAYRRGWYPRKNTYNFKQLSNIDDQGYGFAFKNGGILKGQHGILTPWYNLYHSKVGEFVRDLMFGKDYNLSDEEYVQKYGYAKPITGTGMLPGKTSMNAFEGVENLVKGSFGTGAKYNAGQQIMKTNAISKTVQPKTASNWDKFLKKSLDEQNKIVKYWDERYSTMRQLQANQKQFKRFVSWINKQ